MSITDDIKTYADKTVTETRKVIDSTVSTAQAQLNDLNGNVQQFAKDVRAQAEKAINVDAIKSSVEPYVSVALGYQATITDRAESIIAELRKDPRLAKAFEVSDVVVGQVHERVVKPVQSLTGTGRKPAPARKPSPTKSARKTASTRPARKTSTTSTAKSTTRPAAKKATARKTATKRTTSS